MINVEYIESKLNDIAYHLECLADPIPKVIPKYDGEKWYISDLDPLVITGDTPEKAVLEFRKVWYEGVPKGTATSNQQYQYLRCLKTVGINVEGKKIYCRHPRSTNPSVKYALDYLCRYCGYEIVMDGPWYLEGYSKQCT